MLDNKRYSNSHTKRYFYILQKNRNLKNIEHSSGQQENKERNEKWKRTNNTMNKITSLNPNVIKNHIKYKWFGHPSYKAELKRNY